ncbi:MAG TPA: serine hydrolase [Tepidisphaeraceae bacterium]|jgi:CubicO group peptidase (beta-lactamase class C family)
MHLRIGLLIATVALSSRADGPFDWRPDTPAAQGMSAEKLAQMRAALVTRGTTGLLVVRHDRIVLEWYAEGAGPDKPHGTASLAKSLVGGMSLALAMTDGRLRPEDLVSKYVPQWQTDPRKSKITIAQLASHTSGLEDAEASGLAHEKLTGWKGEFWKRAPTDPFTISRDQVPVIYEPGERASYSNPGMAMLAYAVTAAIQGGEQKEIRTLLRDRVLRPIGVKDAEWSVGYGKPARVGDLNLYANWGGAAFTARATARVGRLMLREGDWDGKRLIDAKVVRQILDYRSNAKVTGWSGASSPRPVLGWYTNIDKTWPAAPRDAFCGAGAGQQVLLVVPSLDLIVVRNGAAIAGHDGFWRAVETEIVDPVMKAVVDPPMPPSDAIRRVRFDPPESIQRKAIDSDNWPMTWGDDDAIYTAYGDGRGFESYVEKKLSLGLAKVEGTPPDFRGTNLRSPTIERTGDGAKGPKASGILMVDGVLFMWVRNTANATLAWSEDRGQTWTWGWRFEEGFGCPTFLNFGRNYEGARDQYVYAYSQDGPDAYHPFDAVSLARVPRSQIRDKAAYEYFVKTGPDGQPTWSRDITDRGPVFAYRAHCERLDAIYDHGLGRYLLAVSYGHGHGWGLFDAPEPWGPWTAAFTTSEWDVPQTHGYRLTSKWMSEDGTRAWLVFSGLKPYDAFCVRRMVLETYRHRSE